VTCSPDVCIISYKYPVRRLLPYASQVPYSWGHPIPSHPRPHLRGKTIFNLSSHGMNLLWDFRKYRRVACGLDVFPGVRVWVSWIGRMMGMLWLTHSGMYELFERLGRVGFFFLSFFFRLGPVCYVSGYHTTF